MNKKQPNKIGKRDKWENGAAKEMKERFTLHEQTKRKNTGKKEKKGG